jgi:general secretion pathway protein F
MIHSPDIRESRRLLAAVRDRIMEGGALAAALGDMTPSLTTFERAILEVGEKSATLEANMVRLADYLDEQDRLMEKIRAALTYPVMVVGLGLCSALIMLGVLVPMMEKMLLRGNIPLPPLTRFMIAMGGLCSHWVTLCMVGLAIAAGVAFRIRLKRDEGLRRRLSMRLFQVPWYGRGYAMLVCLRFARALAMLVRSGASLVDSLGMAGRATGNPWVAHLAAVETEAVRHGEALSQAIMRIPPLAGSLPGWVQTGEASGELASMLEVAAGRLQEHWSRYVNRCMSWLAPLLILLVGGFVLLLALSVLMPVFSISQTLGGAG